MEHGAESIEQRDLEAISAGEEYFMCEQYHCRLRKLICVARQIKVDRVRKARETVYHTCGPVAVIIQFSKCYDCEQGLEIARELGVARNPVKAQQRKRPKSKKPRAIPLCERRKKKLVNKYSKRQEFPDLASDIRAFRQKFRCSQQVLGQHCGVTQSVISMAELARPIAPETATQIEAAIKSRLRPAREGNDRSN